METMGLVPTTPCSRPGVLDGPATGTRSSPGEMMSAMRILPRRLIVLTCLPVAVVAVGSSMMIRTGQVVFGIVWIVVAVAAAAGQLHSPAGA